MTGAVLRDRGSRRPAAKDQFAGFVTARGTTFAKLALWQQDPGADGSMPSPARPTGVLPEASAAQERPKPDGQAEGNGNTSKILLSPLEDEVVTDAVPSPARPTETIKPPGQPEQKQQPEQNIPSKSSSSSETPSLPKTEIPSDKKESSQVPKFTGSRRRHDRQTSRTSNITNISNCSGFVIGTVLTIPVQRSYSTQQSAEDDVDLRKRRMKYYNKLLTCPDELHEDDIIIVSECLEESGLHSLLQELSMDAEVAEEIIQKFKCKGLSEIIHEILTRWKCMMTVDDQAPRLNLFCSTLLRERVYNNGGGKALKGLLKHHF